MTTTIKDDHLAERVRTACNGDARALEDVVRGIQDRVYGLALRTLGRRADAEDATQEILVLVVTNLGSFRSESKFSTWVYRIATRFLIRDRARHERRTVSLETIARELGQPDTPVPPWALQCADIELLAEEVFLGCSSALLLALDRPHRLAFILADVLHLDGEAAAAALDIQPATLRKRVSRARRTLDEFLGTHCSVVSKDAPCKCDHQVAHNVRIGRLDPRSFVSVASLKKADVTERRRARLRIAEMGRIKRTVELYRGHPELRSPIDFGRKVGALLAQARH